MEDLRDFMKESEANARKVLETIKDICPCILFLDEVERIEAEGGRDESKIKKSRQSFDCS